MYYQKLHNGIRIILLAVLLLFNLVLCDDIKVVLQDLSLKISDLDQVFRTQGPTISILQNYDSIISEINKLNQTEESFVNFEIKYLPNLYYKKGLIEFSIDKELFAIQSFEKCYKLNKSVEPCKQKLLELYLKNGKLEKLEQLSEELKDSDSIAKINYLQDAIKESQQAISFENYTVCVQKISDAIAISPSFNELRQIRINCLENDVEADYNFKLKTLIDDYSELIKNGQYSVSTINKVSGGGIFDKFFKKESDNLELKPLDNFIKIFKLTLFGNKEFEKSQKFLQKCLRIDNDYIDCQQYSKFFVKLNKFWVFFEKISIYYSHIYFQREDEGLSNEQDDSFQIDQFEISESEWAEVYEFLFNPAQKLKLTKRQQEVLNIDKFETNFELIFLQSNNFAKEFKFPPEDLNVSNKVRSEFYSKNVFVNELLKIAIESIVMTRHVSKHEDFLKGTCLLISPTVRSDSRRFLACEIIQIDKLLSKISKKEYMKALKLLTSMSPRLRKTQLWKSRHAKIESKYPQQDRRQQQQRFNQQYQNSQQQQHFFHQQQQQQQQQAPPPQQFPDIDYYKVLEVPKNADDGAIKKLYRDKVKQFHPDKNKNSDLTKEQLEQKMSDINNAYEVLSDKDKRQQYDQQGQGGGGGGGGPRFRQQQQQHPGGFGGFGGGFGGGDFFGNMFRQQQQQQQLRQRQQQQQQQFRRKGPR